MSELVQSLEKSVEFLRTRYPDGNPLLTCLETQLNKLKARKARIAEKSLTKHIPAESTCCNRLEECAFFEDMQHIDELSDVLQEFITVYCCGPAKASCYRLKYLKEHGCPTTAKLSPAGDDYSKYL
ncbi:MAG: hypothetical protein RQ754_01430 [Desulfuromonadales bacterium]|jgi:hypothetical protein|nr:hypothetical protein [Desulfuromonadales bacterium]